mmetsp:Transcript_64030/g.113624  ORF Transcript_64030/g.113624 Transcript_64030/m.113624 type:complete len:82 (-) Transcript_64030:675-920(-)
MSAVRSGTLAARFKEDLDRGNILPGVTELPAVAEARLRELPSSPVASGAPLLVAALLDFDSASSVAAATMAIKDAPCPGEE